MHPRKRAPRQAERAAANAAAGSEHEDCLDLEIIQMSTPVGCPPFGRQWGPIPRWRPIQPSSLSHGPLPHAPHAPHGPIYRASRTARATPQCAEEVTGQLDSAREPEPSSRRRAR